jgi:hypothetical protein
MYLGHLASCRVTPGLGGDVVTVARYTLIPPHVHIDRVDRGGRVLGVKAAALCRPQRPAPRPAT